MQYEQVRDMVLRQWKYTGGPNEAKASELCHDDVVLESPSPTSGSSARPNSRPGGRRYPEKLNFEPREIRGSGDLWIAEAVLTYDSAHPVHVVKILTFRGDKVERETLSFAEPFEAPDWRQPWAEDGPRPRRHDGLPEHVDGGT